jgi:hypothetical protein
MSELYQSRRSLILETSALIEQLGSSRIGVERSLLVDGLDDSTATCRQEEKQMMFDDGSLVAVCDM